MSEKLASATRVFGLLFVIAAVCGAIYYLTQDKFNVVFKVCDSNYQNCSVIAKFKDRYDCETTREYWSWLCDSRDKSNISCKPSSDSLATGYCE